MKNIKMEGENVGQKLRVVVTGACGKMGRETIRAVLADPELELAGAVDVQEIGRDLGEVIGSIPLGINICDDLSGLLGTGRIDVLVDFTNPQVVYNNICTAIQHQVSVVIGTTGLTENHLESIRSEAEAAAAAVLYVPNFAIGAVLLMRLSQQVAKYMPEVEIIEMHHNQKHDAPSGTSLRTAELIIEARTSGSSPGVQEYLKIPGVRGGEIEGIHIHSVRLPGLVAHQEVIFGGLGQTLTIRHDSYNRESFMPGVVLAIKAMQKLRGVVVGLENILDL